MPELPEVETVRRGLSELIVGRTITSVEVRDSPKSFPNDPHAVEQFVLGATVTAVRRRAKVLLIELSSDYTLVGHLKMTGQLVWVAGGQAVVSVRPLPSSPTRVSGTLGTLVTDSGPVTRSAPENVFAGLPQKPFSGAAPPSATRASDDLELLAILAATVELPISTPSESLTDSADVSLDSRREALDSDARHDDSEGAEAGVNDAMSASEANSEEDKLSAANEDSKLTAQQRFGAGHPNDSLIGALPDKSTRVVITFDDDSHLYFNDQRKFGWLKLYPTVEVPHIAFMQKVGPEPLEDSFTADDFIQRIRRRNGTTIKAAILDQTVLAGVGNIYADESLWGAKIHPATRVRDVSDEQLTELLGEIKYVMNLSIEKGGSTDKNYVNAEGKRGSYIDFARVFRREGLACPRHPDVLIEKLRVAGRGTHICPVCQVAK